MRVITIGVAVVVIVIVIVTDIIIVTVVIVVTDVMIAIVSIRVCDCQSVHDGTSLRPNTSSVPSRACRGRNNINTHNNNDNNIMLLYRYDLTVQYIMHYVAVYYCEVPPEASVGSSRGPAAPPSRIACRIRFY